MVCKEKMCTGCMACVVACPKKAITIQDNISYFNAIINDELCVNCNICKNICQINNPCIKAKPLFWKQGWAKDSEVRNAASSGGIATALMHSIINSGGVVVSCELKEGQFIYSSSSNISYIKRYVGSKYTKSNPLDAYRLVDDYLKKGKEVLFIGLPCHVAGIKKFIGAKKSENLYLVDLICHGTPSQKLLKMFLDDNGVDIENIKELYFRKKDSYSVSLKEGEIVPVSVIDRYTMGFLSGLFYTDNCYDCKYASVDRVSDLTLGDSWGTDLKDEASKGISLVLCNSFKGKKLLEKSELVLFDVDCKIAVKHNGQLDHPSEIRPERNKFFKLLYKWNSFSKAVFYVYPKYCIKQEIKAFLIKKRHWKNRREDIQRR